MLIHWIDYNNKWFLKKSQEIENKDDIWNEFVKEPKCSHIMISKNGKLIQSSKDLECLEENDNEFFTIVNKTNSIPRPINPQDNNYHFLNSILNSALPELRQLFGEENHIEINDNGQIEIG